MQAPMRNFNAFFKKERKGEYLFSLCETEFCLLAEYIVCSKGGVFRLERRGEFRGELGIFFSVLSKSSESEPCMLSAGEYPALSPPELSHRLPIFWGGEAFADSPPSDGLKSDAMVFPSKGWLGKFGAKGNPRGGGINPGGSGGGGAGGKLKGGGKRGGGKPVPEGGGMNPCGGGINPGGGGGGGNPNGGGKRGGGKAVSRGAGNEDVQEELKSPPKHLYTSSVRMGLRRLFASSAVSTSSLAFFGSRGEFESLSEQSGMVQYLINV